VAGKGVKHASHWVAPWGLAWLQLGQVVMGRSIGKVAMLKDGIASNDKR
jgi:hypothetical protein